jgi:dihydrodipicolinate synthase/N-acetylneuraminate lyase
MHTAWAGVFPALTTKFKKEDLALDLETMAQHIEAQLEAGVHGLIVAGSLGENSVLSMDEKLTLLKTTLSVSDGRVPVLLTVAETTTADACSLVEQGAAYGTSGFMVLPPMRYTSDRRETLQYLRTVAAASERPLMIYNNPVAYGVDVTPEMFAELANEPKFVAIKESSADVRRVTDIINLVGDRYQIFCGVDDLILESLMLGAVGWVAGMVGAFPREAVVVYELAKAGRYAEARDIYRWFMPALHLDFSTKLVQNIKLAEAMTGLGTEHVRPPRLPLAGKEREQVEKIISKALATRPILPDI